MLAAALDSLLAVDHPIGRLQVIVVDDSGGDPHTTQVVRARQDHPVIPLVVYQERMGAAAARNRGARLADGDVVLFCDDDIIVEADHVRRHLQSHRDYARALVNGVWEFAPDVLTPLLTSPFGRYRLAVEGEFQAEANGGEQRSGCVTTRFVTAMNLSLRRELFWELHGFDEAFPFAGAEDQDLSIRARLAGATLIRNHDIRLLNNESIVTFRSFCAREERSAQTVVVLAQKLPTHAANRPVITRNAPIDKTDTARLVAVKLVKALASGNLVLHALHRLVDSIERSKLPDGAIWWLYRRVLALHIFRGVRKASTQVGQRRQ
jgi:GT2 family glycosyltransferase